MPGVSLGFRGLIIQDNVDPGSRRKVYSGTRTGTSNRIVGGCITGNNEEIWSTHEFLPFCFITILYLKSSEYQ